MQKMDRVFSSKTEISSYLLLVFSLTATVYAMWNKTGLIYAPCLVLTALIVERIIHSRYVVTADGQLVIEKGRLSKTKTIPLRDINRIDQVCRFHIAGRAFGQYIIIVMGSGEQVPLQPKNESDFVQYISKRRRKMDLEENATADTMNEQEAKQY